MAIKEKQKKKSDITLPPKMHNLAYKAFAFGVMEKKYGESFKDGKVELMDYLTSNTDGINIDVSSTLPTPFGSITLTERNNYTLDKDAIEGLVTSGKLSLRSLCELASINAEKLRGVIGDKEFDKISESSQTRFLTLKASSDFKAKFDDVTMVAESTSTVETGQPTPTPAPEKKEPEKKEPKKFDRKKSAKSIAAEVAEAEVSTSDDLDAILGV